MKSFSERLGLHVAEAEIRIREDAPSELRHILPVICHEVNMRPSDIRAVVCRVLLKAPDRNNWSEVPNIADEVTQLLSDCDWFKIYDVIEGIHAELMGKAAYGHTSRALRFCERINQFFWQEGIGWQLENGHIEVRGAEAFELAVRHGRDELWAAGRQTAATELHEAIADLSKRPVADLTGAIQHGLAALECVARDKCHSKDTLGALLSHNPGLFPAPIDQVVRQSYGWASNHGRHLQEGQPPTFDEAELMVGISGILCRYLSRKL